MKRVLLAAVVAAGLAGVLVTAQSPTPYKLGTFELQGRSFVGVVLRDADVIDLAAADKTVPVSGQRVAMPTDMKDLIARYDAGLRARIVTIVAAAAAPGARPGYLHQLTGVRTLPPVMYPTTILNAAVNYREHGEEV